LQALDVKAIRKALLGYGWLTCAIIVRIHWHALRLWLKRVPFFTKPVAPSALVTRS
jgi:DUF1365 family protein